MLFVTFKFSKTVDSGDSYLQRLQFQNRPETTPRTKIVNHLATVACSLTGHIAEEHSFESALVLVIVSEDNIEGIRKR